MPEITVRVSTDLLERLKRFVGVKPPEDSADVLPFTSVGEVAMNMIDDVIDLWEDDWFPGNNPFLEEGRK